MARTTHTGSKVTKGQTNGSAQRRSSSWIESFVEWGEHIDVPVIYKTWAAIATIGAVLEQHAHMLTKFGRTYPNLYVMLIGPPGTGKTVSIKAIRAYLKAGTEVHLGSLSVTGASLIKEMEKATRTYYYPKPGVYNSLLLLPHDLQALLSEYNPSLVANMTVFYDVEPYTMTRKTGNEEVSIESPQLSMLAGTTPSQLLGLLPPGAWEEGFMSRVVMVYSEEEHVKETIFFSEEEEQDRVEVDEDLVHDLAQIFKLAGQFRISQEYKDAIDGWRKGGQQPKPSHPKLKDYCTRREAQVLKLSMISCADRGDGLRLEKLDYDRALKWLISAERTMPNVFETTMTTDARTMHEIVHAMGNKEIFDKTFLRLVTNRVPINSVAKIIGLMVDTGMITMIDKKGNRYFKATDSL
jgi:hypothetical protein